MYTWILRALTEYLPLKLDSISFVCFSHHFQFRVLVYDQSIPENTGTATVRINVLRSSQPPTFINTPYFSSINVNFVRGTTIFTASAIDSDLQVKWLYICYCYIIVHVFFLIEMFYEYHTVWNLLLFFISNFDSMYVVLFALC